MVWGSLQYDVVLYWSVIVLLVVFVEVFVILLVFLCVVFNFCINFFIRLFGFYIFCICCMYFQKELLENVVKIFLKDFVILWLKLISVFIVSEVGLSDICDSDDFLRDVDFNKFLDLFVDFVLFESMFDKLLLEVFFEDE